MRITLVIPVHFPVLFAFTLISVTGIHLSPKMVKFSGNNSLLIYHLRPLMLYYLFIIYLLEIVSIYVEVSEAQTVYDFDVSLSCYLPVIFT